MNNLGNFFILFIICLVIFSIIDRKLVLRWKMTKIDAASGTQFEKYLKYVFEQMGYRVRHTGKTGDYGADLILYRKHPKEKIVVQAKRYRQSVGQEAVREAVAAKGYYNADSAIVVTNSTFTPAAKQLAHSNHVILYDRKWVYRVIRNKNLKEIPKTDNETTISIKYCRSVKIPDNCNSKSIEHMLDEFLEDAGYTVINK